MLCIVQCASIMLFFVVVVVFMCEWHAVVTTQSSALSFARSLSLSLEKVSSNNLHNSSARYTRITLMKYGI